MKYVLMFGETKDRMGTFENWTEEHRRRAYAEIDKWFHRHGNKIQGGYQLQPERTATTVRFDEGKPSVSDGPFIEGKEVIGGYAEIDVPDLDEAIAMAKEWPTGGPVEVRPVIEQNSEQR
jgi:hypothetical protein